MGRRPSSRPARRETIEHDLREFRTWLAERHPEVSSCADLGHGHIEEYKSWLATAVRPRTGKPLIFAGDLPIIDKPLPRFLDDAVAANLLPAAQADTYPLARLVTELLARTGIRRGQLLELTVDAVVQIGSAFWVRIPVGKLHNDRYIPLHPQLKEPSCPPAPCPTGPSWLRRLWPTAPR